MEVWDCVAAIPPHENSARPTAMPSFRISSCLRPAVALLLLFSAAGVTAQPPIPEPDVATELEPGAVVETPPGPNPAAVEESGASATGGIVPVPDDTSAAQPSAAEPLMSSDVFLPADLPTVRPPRGTLGITYFRHTHPVPDDKHPRLGMLAVRDKQRFRVVVVRGMGGLRLKNGVWLFESDRPLDPGASHVVCIEAKDHIMDVGAITKRYVRLIPGRIVYLDFSDPSED